MGIPFHETVMGHQFFQSQLPQLTKALNRLAEAVEESNRLPKNEAVEMAPVIHGHWKLKVDSHGPDVTGEYWEEPCLVCSECGREEPLDFNVLFAAEGQLEKEAERFPFCHCGAKMDGGVECDCD